MPPSKQIYSGVLEKHRNNTEISILWKIPKIFKETTEGYQVVSGPIRWLETSWRLSLYPNGMEGLEPGWLDLSLTSSCIPKKNVRVTFGLQEPDETEYLVLQDQKFGAQDLLYHNVRFMKKADVEKHTTSKKRKGLPLPYTTIIIICIIRIENSSQIAEKSIPSTNLGETGRIEIPTRRPSGDQLSIEWTISRPFTLGNVLGDYYSSPEFEFLNTKWRLRVYPFGHPVQESTGWVGVDVWKLDLSSCKRPVLLTLGIKQANSQEATSYVNETLARYRRLWSGYHLAKRTKLMKKRFEEALTITCTLQPDELPSTSAAADACVEEMAPPDTEMVEGIYEINRSTSELSLEWRIREFSSKMYTVGDHHDSPIIEFLNMSWILKIYPRGRNTEPMGWMTFEVWKLDWTSEPQPVFVTLGIKKTDSMEEVIFRSEKLPGHRRLWRTAKFMQLAEVHRRRFYIAFADVVTITCTLCSQDAFLSTISTNPAGETEGTLRERECNSHKEVEWDLCLGWKKKISPVFTMGSQTYWMKWGSVDYDNKFELRLYSLGPPIGLPQPTIWWAGLKRVDGKFLFINTSGYLNMKPSKNVQNVYVQKNLFEIRGGEITCELKSRDITIFLQFNVERPSTSEEHCSHPVIGMSDGPRGFGYVEYLPCDRHVQAEWLLYRSISFELSPYGWTLSSDEISCLDEVFKFEWSAVPNETGRGAEAYVLNAYSRRLSTVGPYVEGRWWAALKRPDGRYELTNMQGTLNAEDQSNMWTIRGTLAMHYLDCIEENLSVVLRYTVKDMPRDPNFSCVHSGLVPMRPKSAGRLEETKFPLYMQVEWSVDYRMTLKRWVAVVSPHFRRGTYQYVLQLKRDREDDKMILLYLHRIGRGSETPTPRYVRWWAGLRRGDGSYFHKNRRGKLDLEEECEIWKQTFVLKVSRDEIKSVPLRTKDIRLSIFLRLSEDRTSHLDEGECNLFLPEPKRKRTDCEDEVIFSVRDREFKMSRNILGYRVPVLDAMFQYDTVEKRTGIVNIEDSEPDVFEEFLHYISYGFIRKPNEYNAFDGYVVADKYLLEDLKIESLQIIGDNISVHNFCDVFSFSVSFEEDDLLKHAIDFFSRNYKIIMQTDEWSQYFRLDRTTAQKLISATFKSKQYFKDNLYSLFSSKVVK